MRTMRQKSDGGSPLLGEKTPNASVDTLSEMNIAPMAFTLNQSNALCLPLVSGSQRLIWVPSSEINLQLDGTAELDKAFDQFPYLTEKQTTALAKRCSLHPDKVKVWFMAQRLRYGISWDYKDIPKVRTFLKASLGKEKLQNKKEEEVKEDRGEKCERKVEDASGKEAGRVREKQTASEGENVRTNDRLVRKMEEQPMKKEKEKEVEEGKGNTQKKQKRMIVMGKIGQRSKRLKQGETAEEVETRSDDTERECEKSTQSETTLFTTKKEKAKADKRLLPLPEWPDYESFIVPDEPLDTKTFDVPPLTDNQTELLKKIDTSTSDIRMTPVKSSSERGTEMQMYAESTIDTGKLKELMDMNINLVADSSPTVTQQQRAADTCTLSPRVGWKTKTQTQLAMMRAAFSHSQYPDEEAYKRLAKVIDVPRYELVRWFGDMRYYVKKGRPGWMSQEQHIRALANIRNQQWLNKMVKGDIRVTEKQPGR